MIQQTGIIYMIENTYFFSFFREILQPFDKSCHMTLFKFRDKRNYVLPASEQSWLSDNFRPWTVISP
jgi:hypothetical protein